MLLFRACAAVEREVTWDDQNHVLYSNCEEAWEVFEGIIKDLEDAIGGIATGTLHYQMALSGSNNFRRTICPGYKAGRSRKPLCYAQLVEKVLREHPALIVDSLEGDDLLGIWATNGRASNPIIVSDDKDLQQIPGSLFRQGECRQITPEQADYFWMFQTLTGDATDGYMGLPGCGPVTATKLLQGEAPLSILWERVVEAYEAKGLSAEDALLQARLARILRVEDWDTEKKEVILWDPERHSTKTTLLISKTELSDPPMNGQQCEPKSIPA
jgi:DNA polymerase-1